MRRFWNATLCGSGVRRALAVCMPLLLAGLLCTPVARAAAVGGNVVRLDRIRSPEGPVLVVTGSLAMKGEQRKSPLAKVALVDGGGGVLRQKKSYGGRRYRPELFAKLGRQAALAATASPVPAMVDGTASRSYQFVFFDVPDTVCRIDFSVDGHKVASADVAPSAGSPVPPSGKGVPSAVEIGKPSAVTVKPSAVTVKPSAATAKAPAVVSGKAPVRPPGCVSPEETMGYGKASLRGKRPSTYVGLLSGSDKVAFAERPVIKSFLDAEVLRLSRKKTAPERRVLSAARPGPRHSPEQARALLAPSGLVPIWEYVRIGMTPDAVLHCLSSQSAGGKGVRLCVMDCASDICEYALEGLGGVIRYRLYFRKKRLISMVMAPAGEGADGLTALLGRMEKLYEGRILSCGERYAVGETACKVKYIAEFKGMHIETLGRTLRVAGSE